MSNGHLLVSVGVSGDLLVVRYARGRWIRDTWSGGRGPSKGGCTA